jgi:hypothetical protein
MTVAKTYVPRPVPDRGPASSDDVNDMTAELNMDLSNLSSQANTNEIAVRNVNKLLFAEFMNARNMAERYEEGIEDQQYREALLGAYSYTQVNFRTFQGPNYHIDFTTVPAARRARVEPMYGEAILPYNDVVNRMFAINTETSLPVLVSDLDYTLTAEDDTGATVDEGTLKNAFNGNNRDYWVYRAAYPLSSDVDSFAVTLDVTLPDTILTQSNMINLHPYPLGQLDVEELKYSTSTADPSTSVPGFTATEYGLGFKRWHFAALGITKLRIKLRQRNFIEENGMKVFYLGAQEVGIQLIEFDKTSGEVQPANNNGLVAVINCPAGYYFNYLRRLYSTPDYATMPSNEIAIRIFSDAALTNKLWDSTLNPRIEDANVDLSSNTYSALYVLVNLAFVTSTSKAAIINNFMLGFDTKT